MGIPRLLVAALLIAIAVAGVAAQEAAADAVGAQESAGAASTAKEEAALRAELEQLNAKISVLESSIAERTKELKSKDDDITKLGKVIEEKSQKVSTLKSEITSLQSKGSVAVEEHTGKANAWAIELEKQIDKLKNDMEAQNIKRAALETRAGNAEKRVQELNAKLEALRKTSDDQKRRIQKTERALKVAEEELMRVQLEATAQSRQLTEVHGAWLPPWLATHAARSLEVVSGHWNQHGKPAVGLLLQKASEKSAQAKKWAEPHLETAKTKWIPVMKEKWVVVKTNTEPYVQKVSTKSVEVYEASRDAIAPHVVKVQEFADPYFQVHGACLPPWLATHAARSMEVVSGHWNQHGKPAVDLLLQKASEKSAQAKKWAEPHLETAKTKWIPVMKEKWVVVKTNTEPYVQKVSTKSVEVYEASRDAIAPHVVKVQEFADPYFQAQETILDCLHKHEATKPLATKELVWFLASALLALPVYILYSLLVDSSCTKKQTKSSRSGLCKPWPSEIQAPTNRPRFNTSG